MHLNVPPYFQVNWELVTYQEICLLIHRQQKLPVIVFTDPQPIGKESEITFPENYVLMVLPAPIAVN